MDRRWVLNSSPIIILCKTSLIWIIRTLSPDLVIPTAVMNEINQGSHGDPAKKWLREEGRVYVRDIGDVDQAVTPWKLGRGESEVISWANRNPSYEAVIDDRAARRCAAALGVRARGTIGVLVEAKRQALVPALATTLAQIEDSGFWIDDALRHMALRLAGED